MSAQIICALPVPFNRSGDIEWESFEQLLTRISPHVHGALVAGTTGEFPALDDKERLEAFAKAIAVLGAERVIAHIGHVSARQVIRLGRAAAVLGITRMATLNPYYLPADDSAVFDFYQEITAALPGIDHYVYLFPERTGITVGAETFGRIMALPGVRGVKLSGASSDDLETYAAHLLEGQELYSGDDSTLPYVLAQGGTGVVSGVSAAYPETFGRLASLLDSKDATDPELLAQQETVVALVRLTGPSILRLKAAASVNVPGVWQSRMPMPALEVKLVADLQSAAAVHA